MRLIGKSALLLVLTASLAAGGDPKPDFSGTWIFNPAKSRLEIEAPTKMIWVTEHRDPKITTTSTRIWKGGFDDSKTGTLTIIDGKEHYKKDGEFESWSRHYWMEEELVWELKEVGGGKEGTIVVHYRLTNGGKTFVAAEWIHHPDVLHHNLWVFDRAPEE